MCKVIALSNSKGGTGKTTTCVNLGIGLVRKGYKVLLIDNDSQGSMTASLGIQKRNELTTTLTTILRKVMNNEELSYHEGILKHPEGVDFLPANRTLADMELVLEKEYGGEQILKEYIDVIRDDYHYILIDCSPSLSYVTLNALCSADSVLIPMEAAFLSVMGLEEQIRSIFKIKKRLNPKLEIEGVLITKINERTVYAKEIVDLINNTYGTHIRIFNSRIPHSVKVEECSAEGISIYVHSPKGKATAAYEALTEEVCR